LEPEQLRALLGSCDRQSSTGRRDYAILVTLARLGTRAGEVAALVLEDVDWRAIVGKDRRFERLPLAVDVGEAIVDYLQAGRPVTAQDRCVFARAPHHGLTPRDHPGRGVGRTARRARPDPLAPAAAHGRDRDAQSGRGP
jgi:integrase